MKAQVDMTPRQFRKWLKRQADLDTLEELYAIVLEGNHGLDAVKAWLDGAKQYDDPDLGIVHFLMASPVAKIALTI